MKKHRFIYIVTSLVIFSACEQDILETEAPAPDLTNVGEEPNCSGATAGAADFSKYVALGNSLTAGFQAGALFDQGQNNSLAKILANHFACAGGGDFNQPDINSENGFLFTGTTNPLPDGTVLGRLLLQGTPPAPSPTISAQNALPSPLNPAFQYGGDKTMLNNFGVPGITLLHLDRPETGDWSKIDVDPAPGLQPHPLFNPFYARFASSAGESTILADAMAALSDGGTFFSFWVGTNDVFGYAVGGASNPGILTPVDPVPGAHPGFNFLFNAYLDALLSVENVKGVVGNIPDITTIPYFTTVKWNPVPLDAQTSAQLTAQLAVNYNEFLDAMAGAGIITAEERDLRKLEYNEGNNSILITDETLTDLTDAMVANGASALVPYAKARQTNNTDLVCLSAGSYIGKAVDLTGDEIPDGVNGVSIPLINNTSSETTDLKGDDLILLANEIAEIRDRTAAFNAIIATKIANSGDRLALADVNTRFNQLGAAGAEADNGVVITATIAPPTGGFSEDGVHPNNRGMAYIANIFIEGINAKFGSTIPKVNLSKYQGTGLPVNP